MAENSRFEFCPKCGAMARDGVCQSCGYQIPGAVASSMGQNQTQQSTQQSYQQPLQQPVQQQSVPAQQVYQQPVQQPVPVQQVYQQPVQQQPIQPQNPTVLKSYNEQTSVGQIQQQSQIPPQNQYNSQVNGIPYTPYNPQAVPKERKKEGSKKTAVIISIIIGLVLVILVTVILLALAGVFKEKKPTYDMPDINIEALESGKGKITGGHSEDLDDPDAFIDDEDPDENTDEDSADEDTPSLVYTHTSKNTTADNRIENGQDPAYSFYSGPYNAFDDSSSYEIAFYLDTCYVKDHDNLGIEIEYPQISGSNISVEKEINENLYYEYSYYEDLLKEYAPSLGDDDIMKCYANAYVTYQDDYVLSVVYHENVYLTVDGEEYNSVAMYCQNYDLQNESMFSNTQILNMDLDFAKDFRNREVAENGVGNLDQYTDEELRDMLNDESVCVAFFTPYGMEIGLNLETKSVYVMYEDFTDYLYGNEE